MRGASRIAWQLNSRLRLRSSPGKATRPTSFAVTVSRSRRRSTPVMNCSATAGSRRVGFGAGWRESLERSRLFELTRGRFPRWRAGPLRTLLCGFTAADVCGCRARARTPATPSDGGDLRIRDRRSDAAYRARRRPARAAARRAAPRHLLRGRPVPSAARAPGPLGPAMVAAVPDAPASRLRIDAGRHLRDGPDGRGRQLLLRARPRRRRRPLCPHLLPDRRPRAWSLLRIRHGLSASGYGAGLGPRAPRFTCLRITNETNPTRWLGVAVDRRRCRGHVSRHRDPRSGDCLHRPERIPPRLAGGLEPLGERPRR